MADRASRLQDGATQAVGRLSGTVSFRVSRQLRDDFLFPVREDDARMQEGVTSFCNDAVSITQCRRTDRRVPAASRKISAEADLGVNLLPWDTVTSQGPLAVARGPPRR